MGNKSLRVLYACVVALALYGCTSQQVIDQAATANALLDLRISYDAARENLDGVIDSLPTETGLALLELQQDADKYVAEVTAAWRVNPDLSPAALDAIYMQGRELYHRGIDIIEPIADSLPPGTITALVKLQYMAERIDGMYHDIKNTDAETQQMIRAGLELATLALRVGVLVL